MSVQLEATEFSLFRSHFHYNRSLTYVNASTSEVDQRLQTIWQMMPWSDNSDSSCSQFSVKFFFHEKWNNLPVFMHVLVLVHVYVVKEL